MRASADIVAKGFSASSRATLIQDQAPMRNVDSKIYEFATHSRGIQLRAIAAVTQ
jgi:hypothetical protein